MLELKNITLSLKKDNRTLIEDFSFTLKNGDKAVIIGEEGNGKSTLLKLIYSHTLVESYCDWNGEIITKNKLAYLPQMLDDNLNAVTLAEYFANTEYYLYTDILARLGLSCEFIFSEQRLGTLSGGEKIKIQLARLYMDNPDILLLDEPTNDLDIPTLHWLEEFISDSKLPVLYISHDETLIENTANVMIHLEQLSRKTKSKITVARCGYQEYLARRKNNFLHQEQVASKQREDYDRQMEKWRQIYNRVDHEQRVITRQNPPGARLLKKKMHTVLSMGRRFERQKEDFLDYPEQEEAILAKFDEAISLPSGKTVLDLSLSTLSVGEKYLSGDIRLFVSGGEHVGITGRNGVGKSTLLRFIHEQLKGRTDITVGYMPQNYRDVLDYSKTPIKHLSDNYSKAEITLARTFMGGMKFTHEEMTGELGSLSGGQKAKILLLDMVLQKANVLLLDEPTRNFSPLSGPVVRHALGNFKGSIISVSHDRKYLDEVCDTVYELTETGLHRL